MLNWRCNLAIDDAGSNNGIRVERIDGGEAAQKGVSELRESQNPIKPAGLTRPQGVLVPPAPAVSAEPASQTQSSSETQAQTGSTEKK
jgi:hypothetical protein